MDRHLRDRRIIVAALVWGDAVERSADRTARRLSPGLNTRDVLLLAALRFDRDGQALPSDLIGPVHTTTAGVSGSLKRLQAAGLVQRSIGDDARTRPVRITPEGEAMIRDTLEPWQRWFDERLAHLDEADRSDLYRLLTKASGLWDDVWPAQYGADSPTAPEG